ncbi:MAG: hypothetical protein HYY76_09930 [Acidobacteria bacterium]|nr:hypothetical protein [Acidobacteriota bacterium]
MNNAHRLTRVSVSVAVTAVLLLWAIPAAAAELQARTVAAFNHYVQLTEARMDADVAFLWLDTQPEGRQQMHRDELRRGALLIERLTTRDAGREIVIPDGLVHHWIGLVFVPGTTVDRALALLQDYDRHAQIYQPAVARSKLLARDGDRFRVYLRFFMKKVITVIVNSEHEARFKRDGRDRAQSRIYSTRIAEVEAPDTPREREKPIGRDGGYLWRLYTYWRFLERDGGTYVQCESISLTRDIPLGFGWLIRPFVTSIPRESLEFTLATTRKTLAS